MCKNAIGSDRNHLAEGINTSVLFMIAMVFFVLFGFIGFVWWNTRAARRRERAGDSFAPPGKLRWSEDARSDDFKG
jgi:heme/copper-type cytochrome/quinol oxidase subunit 2